MKRAGFGGPGFGGGPGLASSGGLSLPFVDFTALASSYPHLTYARSGGNVEGSNGANATQVFAAGVPIWEDRGDGYGGGLDVMGGWTNVITSPNDFSNTPWIPGSGAAVYTAPPVAGGLGPDGTTQAPRLVSASVASNSGYYLNIIPGGATSGRASLWYKNDATSPPTAPGGWMGQEFISQPAGVQFASSSSWRRASGVWNIGTPDPYIFLWPCGFTIVNGVDYSAAWDNAQSGGVNLHGAQVASGQAYADVPLGYGTIGATSAKVDASVAVNAAGDLFLQLDVSPLYDALSFYGTNVTPAIEDGYVVSLPCAAGLYALRYSSATAVWIVTANGTDVLTTPATAAGNSQIGCHSGDRVVITLVHAPSLGVAGLSLSVNGAQGDPCTYTPAAGALVPTDGLYLGSNVGADFWAMRVGRVSQLSPSSTPFARAPQGICFGDSQTAATDGLRMTPATMLTALQSRTHAPIAVLAVGGEPITGQKTRFDASPLKTGPAPVWAIIRSGANELTTEGLTGAQIATNIQALVNDLVATWPAIKVFVSQPLPFWGDLTAPEQTQWTALAALVPSLTGIAGVLSTGPTALDNGSHAYLPQYNLGDNLHPNDLARVALSAGDVADMAAHGVTV